MGFVKILVYLTELNYLIKLETGLRLLWASQVTQWKRICLLAGDSGDPGLMPALGRSPGGGHDNPFEYSSLRSLAGQSIGSQS